MIKTTAAIVINGRLEVSEEDRAVFLAAVRKNVAETRTEEGCLHYTLTSDVDDPSVFYLIEAWDSQEALDAHLISPGFRAANAEVSRLRIRSRVFAQFEVRSQTDPTPIS